MTTSVFSEQEVVANQNGQIQLISAVNGVTPGTTNGMTNGAANGRYTDALVVEDWVSEDGHYVSEALYWEKYYHHPYFNYEWNNGILEEKPRLPNLIDDEVYPSFILPEYQAERRRAEEERLRAEQEHTRAEEERLRAEQERTRADRFAAKLRALGILEDEL